MAFDDIIKYWDRSSGEDFKVAEGLYNLGHYSYCLFFCHLALEKKLKSVYVTHNKEHAPAIHDLLILARKSGISVADDLEDHLETITGFNIQTRYPDWKLEFHKKYNNREYAEKYLAITRDIMLSFQK